MIKHTQKTTLFLLVFCLSLMVYVFTSSCEEPPILYPTPSQSQVGSLLPLSVSAIDIPVNQLVILDDLTRTLDRSGVWDQDDPSDRRLALRWNYGEKAITDSHIYISINGGAYTFFALTGDNRDFFEWSESSADVELPFQGGPVFGMAYRFKIFCFYEGGSVSIEQTAVTYFQQVTRSPGDLIPIVLSSLTYHDVKLEMAFIPSGRYLMGSPDTELDRFSVEGPVHEVEITRDFYVSHYEITYAQWEAVMGESADFDGSSNYPVERVSWFDCIQFCNRLSEYHSLTPVYNESTGMINPEAEGFRLLTESEWEYACRAETETRYYWGDDLEYTKINDYAWYQDNSLSSSSEVGMKLPNSWGLYDMNGSMGEWCYDGFGNYSPDPQIDPMGDPTNTKRTIRGGKLSSSARFARSAFRSSASPDLNLVYTGLRIALTRNDVIADPVIPPTPTATPTLTPTPTATPTPTSTPTPRPEYTVHFAHPKFTTMDWTALGGGFSDAPEGIALNGNPLGESFPDSIDQKGAMLTVNPGQVILVHARTPVQLDGEPAFVRARVWSNNAYSQIFIGGLDGQMNGSLGMTHYTTSQHYEYTPGWFTAFYDPKSSHQIIPFVQVAGGHLGSTNVLVDKLEVRSLSKMFDPPTLLNDFTTPLFDLLGWKETPGGFGNAPGGTVESGVHTLNLFSDSGDSRALRIVVNPGEVSLFTLKTGIEIESASVLRIVLRASNSNAQLFLGALKGTLETGVGVDGSLGMTQLMDSSDYDKTAGELYAYFEPDSDNIVTPFFQVAGSGDEPTEVLIDRIELFQP